VFLLPCVLLNGEVYIFINKIVLASAASDAGSNEIYERSVERSTFFVGSLVTGCFGFLLGLAGLLSIKVTSPVSHMVSSAARSVLQTILGIWLFGEIVTRRRAFSICVITLGALYYTWIQSSSLPVLAPTPAAEKELEEEEKEKEELSKARRVPREWLRHHGHTQSLATLLPLHAPRAVRPLASPSSSGSFPASPGSASGEGGLGSISEEDEYYANGRGAVDEEKMALLPEDDRDKSRFFRDHVRERARERE